MPELTLRQLEILRFLQRHHKRTGMYATVRDMCDHFGWASTSSGHSHLLSLEKKGFVTRRHLTSGVFVWWPTERWWE
jgi:SOS-response transcriptional repressor LexA